MAQRLGDKSGVSCRGIGQAKRHPNKLVLPKQRRERGFLPIGSSDRDGVEGPSSIKSREDVATRKVGQIFGDVGKREVILLRDGVESPVVNGPADLLACSFWEWGREGKTRVSRLLLPLVVPATSQFALSEIPP